MRSSYAAAAVTVTVTVTVTAILSCISHHRRSSDRQRTDKSDSKEMMSSDESLGKGRASSGHGGGSRTRSMNEPTRFPWEPAHASGSADGDVVGEMVHMRSSNGQPPLPAFQNETESTPSHHQQQQDQLDFLASMTFASSGLRQPNCPCCI